MEKEEAAELRTITLSEVDVEYVVKRRRNKANLTLKVDCLGKLYAYCSLTYPMRSVEDFIREKQAWIFKIFEQRKNTFYINRNKIYATDDDILFFGEKKTIIISPFDEDKVSAGGDFIFVWSRDETNANKNNALLKRFFQDELEKKIRYYYDRYVAAEPKLECYEFRYKVMTRTLGKCDYSHKILSFNRMLYAYPAELIEYVVLHELMHLLQPNHSPKFYAEVRKRMDDHNIRDKRLNNYSIVSSDNDDPDDKVADESDVYDEDYHFYYDNGEDY